MSQSYEHYPVLLQESLAQLNVQTGGVYIDCTFGRGGHSQMILDQLGNDGQLVAIDQDIEAVKYAESVFSATNNFRIMHASFTSLAEIAKQLDLLAKVDGILIDLGVSSPQFDQPERGFSLKQEGPLDMRMDQRLTTTAASWLQQASIEEMTRVFRDFGEERYAGRVARRIAGIRVQKPLENTLQLAELVKSCIPNKAGNVHPATRVFQAIRIHINDELGALQKVLAAAADVLRPGGRLVVISFHSLEDRIVKRFFRGEPEPIELRRIPLPRGSAQPFKVVGKMITPSEQELASNPRSRSARMRVGERL